MSIEKSKVEIAKAKDEAILTSIGDGVITIAKDGTILFMNNIALKLLHLEAKAVMGKSYHPCWWVEDKNEKRMTEDSRPIEIVLKNQKIIMDNSYFYVNKNVKIPVAITIAPIIFNGELFGVVDVFRDVTHERQVEQAKTEFVSLASHQLRTPLTGIEWTIDLFAKKEKLTKLGKKYLQYISFSAHRLSTLIKLLLSVSRIEGGSIGVFPAPIELVGFIKKYLQSIEILVEKKKISLTFTVHPQELIAITDSNLLTYILQNILSNALNYTPSHGKIAVRLSKKADFFSLEVQDSGIGIPKNEQARIFQKFTRASNAPAVQPDGTGLGLYIVLKAVKLLGGKIWFMSPAEVGKEKEYPGTTFFVELPLKSTIQQGEKMLEN